MPTLATDEASLNVDELAQEPQPEAFKTAYLNPLRDSTKE